MSSKIYLIGLGPGREDCVTPQALDALGKSQVVIGHKDAFRLLSGRIEGKEVIWDNMSPVARSRLAVEMAAMGSVVAVVSSGHPGIYAIASTLFDHLKRRRLELEVEVIPGMTLADYAAARLGSPLGGDFAVISLADQAGSWLSIRNRIEQALAADFVLVIYNPLGKLDARRMRTVIKQAFNCRLPSTPVGLLTDAGGAGERISITTLSGLNVDDITADTLVLIGSSKTYLYMGGMITPRPYREGAGY
jgi:precorrin-3B C17-methyltransferase